MPNVEGFITRKSMLYKTGVEYGDYTINFVQGCAHGCKYPCYAFSMKKRFGQIKSYEEWLIKKLNKNGIKCCVLTKGVLPEELAKCSKKNEYGITLISLDEGYRERIEPGAAPYAERLAALRRLHDLGCKTWVSIEPYPTPNLIEQDLGKLLEAVGFVDKIIFGRTNYSKEVTSGYPEHKQFYNERAADVKRFCKEHKIKCHIKEKTITTKMITKKRVRILGQHIR